ncbi:hypothetical protein ACD631_19555 [Alteromonas macleodii]|uniref:hypothetical protein n=1 Tax=Alteromonas macleodii TaxID=28108 RepID=UPI0020769C98|nr:hypothetical protein [Alteromonas macleodii]USI28535.1 hypothetical protein NFG60_02245 [Alteromonas macleodii]
MKELEQFDAGFASFSWHCKGKQEVSGTQQESANLSDSCYSSLDLCGSSTLKST